MRWLLVVGVAIFLMQECVAPPVVHNKETDDKKEEHEDTNDVDSVEYHRYLREVVEVLEGDPEFRAKLKNLSDEDIKSAKIAQELDFVNHNVRTKLDEIKRVELERLRQLATKAFEAENHIDIDHLKIAEHIDHTNPHTFEVDDLKRLILKATADLAEEDRKRRENFKEYEMEKKFEQEEKKKKMDEEHKKKYEEELKMMEKKHKEHKPLHHPGSKQQLEEVWEQQDHMEPENFDPRAFFFIHDLDGNRYWDQNEVKALFLKELDKMYNEGAPEDDLRERAEELERMREHVFNEADVDKDGLISLKEFLEQTKKPEFNKDEGWDTVDETPVYTEEDYQAFLQKRHQEIQQMVAKGILPPDYGMGENGHPQQFPPQHANIPAGHGVPPHQQQQFHGQLPPQQQYQGQLPPQQQYQGQVPPQQQYQGQVPHQQQYQGQVPPQHIQQQQYQAQNQIPQYQGQVPQYQGHPAQGQAAPQYHQQQVPQQQQYGQVPVQQQQQHGQQGQVPVQQQQHQGQIQIPVQPQHQDQIPVQQQQQGQIPVQQQQQQQHVQQGQVPVQQNAIPVQQKPVSGEQNAIPVQKQNTLNQANVQKQNVPVSNNQAGHNQVPAEKSAAGNSASAPNVVGV